MKIVKKILSKIKAVVLAALLMPVFTLLYILFKITKWRHPDSLKGCDMGFTSSFPFMYAESQN